ncbi:MAG: ATP-binding protein [Woeseiaceae bacterium]|nr:ATP-binding protein [Woeseiaceae bacterium]
MKLLFRSFLFLVGGLLLVAVVLDFGFGQLQSKQEPDVDRWLTSTLALIEADLVRTPPADRSAKATELADTLGLGVQLLASDDVHINLASDQQLTQLVDADGNTSWLYKAGSLDSIVRLGPIAAPKESLLLELLPPVFYLSILVVVGLWLRPILRDINVISSGASRFAADYREPLSTADQTTELKSLAKNLDEMAARLSGVLSSQKELIAALSHEMRTPLARIRFALAVLGEDVGEPLKEKLAAMNDDVQEIDDLVASMLNYARLDHPDIEMHWQDVPAEAWLEQIVAKAPGDAIKIETTTGEELDTVRFDARLMELALSNLLVNATRYAESEVRCMIVEERSNYVLSVEDDGGGIPDSAKEAVFKAFARIDDSRNRETGGYGLGLAVVARVAELHGGTAAVDTSPTMGGARISISWPA